MADEFDFASVGGRLIVAGNGTEPPHWNFGLLEQAERNTDQRLFSAMNLSQIPDFKISGAWQLWGKRVPLWSYAKKLLGRHLRYNWQVSGSCVGAGGDNCRKTSIPIEIVLKNEPEEFKDVWWLFTYGWSRTHSGMNSPGEGSTGEGWAKAATENGCFWAGEQGLPQLSEREGWLQVSGATERQWSTARGFGPKWNELGRAHLFQSAARCRSADDCVAALANGYCLTQASNFGFSPMAPAPSGDPPVRVASWNGSWAHQTYVDEYWEHPTHGELFRWGNNWGPGAHGNPVADEPPGGVYIKKATMDRICRTGEVFAFSGFAGFPARKIDHTP